MGKPTVQVINSDLNLANSMLHHKCMSEYYDVRERATLTQTDRTAGLWWKQKGSATSTSPPDQLLQLHNMDHWLHQYTPHHYFVIRVDN